MHEFDVYESGFRPLTNPLKHKNNTTGDDMKSQFTRNQSQGRTQSTLERVQQRAYDLYMKRGQEPGHELEDWLLAEEQVRTESENSSKAEVSR